MLLDGGWRADRQDFTCRHDGEAVAIFGLFHEMGGDHDGDALFGKRIDALPELAARERIHSGCRFIQKQNIRFMHQRASQCQALLVAEGQIAAGGIRQRRQGKFGQCPVHALLSPRARQAIGAAEEAQVLHDAEVAIEREFLRHVADARACGSRRMPEIDAGNPQAAAARRQQAAQHAKSGGLAGAIGAQQAEDLAARHCKADVFDGAEIAETPLQLHRFDDGVAVFRLCGRQRFGRSRWRDRDAVRMRLRP